MRCVTSGTQDCRLTDKACDSLNEGAVGLTVLLFPVPPCVFARLWCLAPVVGYVLCRFIDSAISLDSSSFWPLPLPLFLLLSCTKWGVTSLQTCALRTWLYKGFTLMVSTLLLSH